MTRIITDLITAFICGALALLCLDAIYYDDEPQIIVYVGFAMSLLIMALVAFSNYHQLMENNDGISDPDTR